MRVFPVVLAASLLVPLAAAGLGSPSTYQAPGMAPPNGLAIALADFRGDGALEMVVQSDDGAVRVLDPTSGAVLALLMPGNAGCTSSCYQFEGVSGPINAPVVADLDKNGNLDIVVASTAGVVNRYELNPAASSATSFSFTKMWEKRFGDFGAWTMDAAPVLGDLDGNGQLDIVVVTEENGVFGVRPDGSRLWSQNRPGGHATPSVRDLDLDGKVDVVVARDDAVIDVLNGASGSVKWSVSLAQYVTPGSVPAAPLTSDVNGDGKPDVVAIARDAHDASNFANDHFTMFAFDSFGKLLWKFHPSWGAPMSHTRSVLVSVNGQKAVLGVDWNTIGHKPGNFERVGPGHAFLVNAATGAEIWHHDLDALKESNKDLVVADAIGDGTQQAIVEGRSGGQEGLLMLDLATGAQKGFLNTGAWYVTRGAVAGNLFGDGKLGLAVPVAQGGMGGVMVYHATHTLNAVFPGWAAIAPPHNAAWTPGNPPPPPPPPGGGTGGSFAVTFGPKGNEWWVETSTSSSTAVVGVTASVNGGTPVDLPKTSWGTWAKSVHAANGALVTLTARDAAGNTAVACYQWTAATTAACAGGGTTPPPPPPPPSGSFAATFNPSKNGNEWWIETYATSSSPISGVDARVDGGAWTPLMKQSWGAWAKSIHAVTGSTVEFKAHDASGHEAVSSAYKWPVR